MFSKRTIEKLAVKFNQDMAEIGTGRALKNLRRILIKRSPTRPEYIATWCNINQNAENLRTKSKGVQNV